ncbi:unnamed protein product, partial [Ectocarpus sp. 8 AP-2014]
RRGRGTPRGRGVQHGGGRRRRGASGAERRIGGLVAHHRLTLTPAPRKIASEATGTMFSIFVYRVGYYIILLAALPSQDGCTVPYPWF